MLKRCFSVQLIIFFKIFFCRLAYFLYLALVFSAHWVLASWRDARVVEEARLESVYTPKAYRGFESRFLRVLT